MDIARENDAESNGKREADCDRGKDTDGGRGKDIGRDMDSGRGKDPGRDMDRDSGKNMDNNRSGGMDEDRHRGTGQEIDISNRYPCDMIKDLLPGYIDGLLSETGTSAVKEHVAGCEECRSCYEAMAQDMRKASEAGSVPEEREVLDGFKKLRRRTRRLKAAAFLAAGLLVGFVAAVLVKVYVIGSVVSGGSVEITESVYDEASGSLVLTGRLNMNGFHVSRVVCKESEEQPFEINMFVYVAETLPFLSSGQEQDTFSATIPNAKGYVVYQAGPGYNREMVYHWKHDHNDKLAELEAEIYGRVPGLDREKDALSYFKGIETVDGQDGITYSVTTMIGEDAYYWWFMDQLAMYGDFSTLDLDIWISLDEPYQIRLFDYRTGEYTQDLSLVGERKDTAEPEALRWPD